MSYKYILKYRKSCEQIITVEAWPRLRKYATNSEKRKPSFTIGSIKGSRTIMLWYYVDKSAKKYDSLRRQSFTRVLYPPDDADAVNDAYRLGLAASVIAAADDPYHADIALKYVMQATKEEVWFWTSKLVGVIGNKLDRKRVLMSIYVMSGAKSVGPYLKV